jgi:thiol-disulfide isomerase/thioredoxin
MKLKDTQQPTSNFLPNPGSQLKLGKMQQSDHRPHYSSCKHDGRQFRLLQREMESKSKVFSLRKRREKARKRWLKAFHTICKLRREGKSIHESVYEINTQLELEGWLKKPNTLLVVELYLGWCGPCRAARPYFNQIIDVMFIAACKYIHLRFYQEMQFGAVSFVLVNWNFLETILADEENRERFDLKKTCESVFLFIKVCS